MGVVHALHVHELARDTKACELVAVADLDANRAKAFLNDVGRDVPIFGSVDELAKARLCDGCSGNTYEQPSRTCRYVG